MDIIPVVPRVTGSAHIAFYDKDGRLISQVAIEARPDVQQTPVPPGAVRAVWIVEGTPVRRPPRADIAEWAKKWYAVEE